MSENTENDTKDASHSHPETPTTTNDNYFSSLNKYNWINLISYALNVFVTFAIGTFGMFDRPNNGEISDKYQTLVTPWGLSFSIWGLIFTWQAIWVVWQFVLPGERNSEGVTRAWYYYPIMTILQAGWTVCFSYELMWACLVFMYGILITLVLATMSLQKYEKRIQGYLLWQAPFSVQTGWIMAASAVMTNVLPVYYEASPIAQIGVASASVVVLIGTAVAWLCSYPVDFAIPLVILWAFGGVYGELGNPSEIITTEFTDKQIEGIRYGVIAGLIIVGASILVKFFYVIFKQRRGGVTNSSKMAAESGKASSSSSDHKKEDPLLEHEEKSPAATSDEEEVV